MATNHTTNYNLNLWEANDKFVREEFNENTSKLDAAIKAVDTKANTKADQTALTALTQTVNQKARIAVGSYSGNGAETRFIGTGFTPKAVFVFTDDGRVGRPNNANTVIGGLAVTGSPVIYTINTIRYTALEIVSNGFNVMYKDFGSGYSISLNSGTHYYVAIG